MRSWYSMPFFSVRPPPLLCSRRPHRTFIPLSPSCRAIVRVETRSLCAHRLNALSNIGPWTRHFTELGALSLSLRTCDATAMAFCQASAEVIKDVGRWNNDAYLRYMRECRGDYMSYMTRTAAPTSTTWKPIILISTPMTSMTQTMHNFTFWGFRRLLSFGVRELHLSLSALGCLGGATDTAPSPLFGITKQDR
jgi:hypothetical protein